jgi:alanine-glyoxylate transaminase / serine-glyoxylate transaminase / serine-pyruvate transaminase
MKDRTLLMIPGPIEFEPAVLSAMGGPTPSHTAPTFIEEFGRALSRLRDVFLAPDGQPFVLAGSGTLAMDSAAANLVEPGDAVVVVNTGFFSERFGAIFERYGAKVTHVRAEAGGRPELREVEAALAGGRTKVLAVTHVDTSTGVLTDVPALAALARRHGALAVVDGVCSVAGETLRMNEWGVDLAFTASQKAIGVPPGLAILMAGPRALEAFRRRTKPVASYYADWTNWLPVMEAYEARRPSYFGTPAVNLVEALDVSLGQILAEGMDARTARHVSLGSAMQAAITALGLGQVPKDAAWAAHTLTAPLYPEGVAPANLLGEVHRAGVTVAGGLLGPIRDRYFRIGHMGATRPGDVLAAVGAIEAGLAACGHRFERGAGVAAASRIFTS